MKLKSFIGAAVFASALLCATPAFAATEYFTIGTPIDLSTGAEVTDLEAGQVIAYPVDVTASSDICTYGLFMQYNADVLTPGVAESSITAAQWDVIDTLGEAGDSLNGLTGAIFSIGEEGRRGFTAYGDYLGFNPNNAGDFSIVWGDHVGRAVNADSPEFYAIYTVKTSVSEDELNKSLMTNNAAKATIGLYNVGDRGNIESNEVKANPCDGAFKITLDGSQLPYWVQALRVDGKDLDACINPDGTTTYEFPVRVNVAADVTSQTFVITAMVTDDEAGTKNSREELLGNVTVDLTGTATTYADAVITK